MAGLHEYKCPCCGGAIEFNSTLQKMKCPYCDTEFDMQTIKDFNNEVQGDTTDNMNWTTSEAQAWEDDDKKHLKRYICNSCGAEIIADETLSSTKCPYCDSNIIMQNQFSDSRKPDYVIPFKLDKEAAKKALLKHYEGKKLLPKVFREANHLDEIKGVYVPVWLFDADAKANLRYRATKVRVWSDARFTYTQTNFFAVMRAGSLGFEKVPVDGSSKMDDDLMESVEPYDFKDAVDFDTAYLAGYLSDTYDVSEEDSISRANDRVKKSTESAFASTVTGYSSVTPEYSSVNLDHGEAKYALYPVWLLNTTWNGQKYTFAMNGQNGKFVGNLPADSGLITKYFIQSSAITAVIVFLITVVLWLI